MLRIVILPAAVSPANIISQKPGGFSITFRKGKYHSGQSPEYHFVHRYSEHRVLSPIIQYRSVFESYKRRQHKFCTAFLLMEPLHKRPPVVFKFSVRISPRTCGRRSSSGRSLPGRSARLCRQGSGRSAACGRGAAPAAGHAPQKTRGSAHSCLLPRAVCARLPQNAAVADGILHKRQQDQAGAERGIRIQEPVRRRPPEHQDEH